MRRGWLALCRGEGMLPLLAPPDQSIQGLYSPCRGELVGRVMGANTQLSCTDSRVGVAGWLVGYQRSKTASPGVFAQGTAWNCSAQGASAQPEHL